MKKYNWYRFTFEDGYFCIMRGMDRIEKAAIERQHGKLISKVFAERA